MTATVYAAQTAMAADFACASRMPMSFSMSAKMMAPAACGTLSTGRTDVTTSVSLFSPVISVRTVLLPLSGVLISLLRLVGLLALIGLTGLIGLVGLLPEIGLATPQGD